MGFDVKILIGETTAYDKKQQLEVKRPKSWLKSVSAFANGEGGTLVFGISDDDQVVGLADAEGDAERIQNLTLHLPSTLNLKRWMARNLCCFTFTRDKKLLITI